MPPRRETRLHAFVGDETPAAEPAPTAPAPGAEPDARSVSELLASVTKALASEPSLQNVWVRGEISNFAHASSGHWYFQLKDANATIKCTMWRGQNARVRFRPEEGMEVLARGRVNVYAARSDVQLSVEELRPVGAGALQIAFEQLKRRLAEEGLFDDARKRDLPDYPRVVGVVTSLEAAALRDVVRVATTRNPAVRLLVAHARVQGDGAAAEVAAALQRLDGSGRCDVIIVGRGGGSVEDLWAFNEEVLVRALAACRTPTVSAVGHETDFTLADLAADVRAPTPSAAAETVVPDAEVLVGYLDDADDRMRFALERLVPELRQRVDDLMRRSHEGARRTVAREGDLLAAQAARLQALSPLGVLARGYAVARRDGRVVRSVDDARAGDEVEVVLRDGALDAKVVGKRKREDSHGASPESG